MKRWWMIIASLTLCLLWCTVILGGGGNAKLPIGGKVFLFDKGNLYRYREERSFYKSNPENTLGELSLDGNIVQEGKKDKLAAFGVNGGKIQISIALSDTFRTDQEHEWHLVEDKIFRMDEIELDKAIMQGLILLESSKDGKTWYQEVVTCNAFASPEDRSLIYTTNDVQLTGGCYYRLRIAYMTAKLDGYEGIAGTRFGQKKHYIYQRHLELYEFYLYDVNSEKIDDNMPRQALGVLTNTGKDNGYSQKKELTIKDVHYGWEMGQFFVGGYTRDTKDEEGVPVFLKNVGDKITLWFALKQDIENLDGSGRLTVNEDKNGYDQYFQTEKMNFGHGALIVQYTDPRGVKQKPEIYTNFLEASAVESADTMVRLFEEGDYEVALDYELKYIPQKFGEMEIAPAFSNYRISFSFAVRNGNCMVYPFDLKNGGELSDGDITPYGFKLDMARSRYLTIDVKRVEISPDELGYREDVRFNRPANDGEEYTQEGMYVFNVKNLYTGENTQKTIFVGEEGILKAMSKTKLSLSQINARLMEGATIDEEGNLIPAN